MLVRVLWSEDLLEMEISHFPFGVFVLLIADRQDVAADLDGVFGSNVVVLGIEVEGSLRQLPLLLLLLAEGVGLVLLDALLLLLLQGPHPDHYL